MQFLFLTEPSVSIFMIRVVLGIIFFAHGAQKVLGWYGGQGLKGTAAFFNSMGMPLPIAYLVCLLEFLSGIGLLAPGRFRLIAGLFIRRVLRAGSLGMHQRDIASLDDLLDVRLHRLFQQDSTQSFHRDRNTRANVRPLDYQVLPGA